MLPEARPFRFGVCATEFANGAALAEFARMAEDLGYGVLSCPDHLNHSGAPLEPMLLLATAAAATSHIQLQPTVLANDFRHPALLAKQAATLHLLSGGRFALGMGAGWYGPEFTAAGIPFKRPLVRIARLEEAITVIRGLHTGRPFDFQGEHFRIHAMTGSPALEGEQIPLMIGGSGPKMLALAARTADSVALNPGLPIGTPLPASKTPYADVTDSKLLWIREAAATRETSPEIQTSVFAAGITENNPEAIVQPIAQLFGVAPPALAGCPHVLAGTVSQCIDTLYHWRERWGISYITLPAKAAREMAPVVQALTGK